MGTEALLSASASVIMNSLIFFALVACASASYISHGPVFPGNPISVGAPYFNNEGIEEKVEQRIEAVKALREAKVEAFKAAVDLKKAYYPGFGYGYGGFGLGYGLGFGYGAGYGYGAPYGYGYVVPAKEH